MLRSQINMRLTMASKNTAHSGGMMLGKAVRFCLQATAELEAWSEKALSRLGMGNRSSHFVSRAVGWTVKALMVGVLLYTSIWVAAAVSVIVFFALMLGGGNSAETAQEEEEDRRTLVYYTPEQFNDTPDQGFID
ncbi:hypothetical protein CCZ00_24670 [Pseudomonas savastanoi pv. fraxini]|nr:hypothetical protein CCZ00_24670 [Pseudomonas savastanoi pv. fraxini]